MSTTANSLMGSGYTNESPPDPMALFQLSNEIAEGANTFSFQKAFTATGAEGGKWGFDVFYERVGESQESESSMSCE